LTAGLNLTFDGLRFARFIDRRTLELDKSALLTEIKNRSQNWAVSDAQLLAAGWPPDRNDDPWQLCCGHDMVELLRFALRGPVGSQQTLTSEDVARSLRLAYSQQDFAASELHKTIADWEANNRCKVLTSI
jgi:hypothetical protein